MTALPRLYAASAVDVFSMDGPAIYGPEFQRLPFSRAVEHDFRAGVEAAQPGGMESGRQAAVFASFSAQWVSLPTSIAYSGGCATNTR